MKRTKDRALETRTSILHAALEVFFEKGYSKTTLEDIAKKAGISKGPIYWNFKNKSDVYVAVMKELFQEPTMLYEEYNHLEESPLDNLSKLIHDRISILLTSQEMRKISEISRHKTEIKCVSDEIYQAFIQLDLAYKNRIQALIESAKEKGEIQSTFDSDVIAITILSYVNGLEDMWLLNPDIFDLKTKLNASIDFLINSLRAN